MNEAAEEVKKELAPAAEAVTPTNTVDADAIPSVALEEETEVPEVNIRELHHPDDIDIDAIRLSYEEELEIQRRKAGQRVALVVLVMMMLMIPLFASM